MCSWQEKSEPVIQCSTHTGQRKMAIQRLAGPSALVIPNVPLGGIGKAAEDEVMCQEKSARSSDFSLSLFLYQCYFSQSPGYRKCIPSFLLHVCSIPTGEKEVLFPKHTFPHIPRRQCCYSQYPPQKKTTCLIRKFSINSKLNYPPINYQSITLPLGICAHTRTIHHY